MGTVAINGLGRIGRAAFKIIEADEKLTLAAVNDLVGAENLAYMLKYDTVYGRYDRPVDAGENSLTVAGREIPLYHEKDPSRLPWKDMGVDVVLECTGVFTTGPDMKKHLDAGAESVILSAPAKGGDVTTVVYGVNHEDGRGKKLVSCASCTTNCTAPVVDIVGRHAGIERAVMTTIHAYTTSQSIVDGPHKKFRRGRAGAANFVPTTTGAAKATAEVLPQYKGKFDGVAITLANTAR